MRLASLLLIAVLVTAGVADACTHANADHADEPCMDDCCQALFHALPGSPLLVFLSVCDRLPCDGGDLNDEPLLQSFFRPPEVA